MNLVEKIYNAGIIGSGGAGFPTHIKANAKAEYLIANAAECEPLLHTDQFLMEKFSEKIVLALVELGKHIEAKHIVIGTKAKYTKQIELLENAVKKYNAEIKIKKLPSFYPLGDEHTLVYEVTGRAVKALGIPLDVGCLVTNVGTLCHIYDAMTEDAPVTEKYISVVGQVKEPQIVKAPVGTSVKDILVSLGEYDSGKYMILGGPMMGKYYPVSKAENLFIGKASGGIILIPGDHYLVRKRTYNPEKIVMLAKSACIQCSFCTDMCPRNMLGHKLRPHMVMRTVGLANRDDINQNDKGVIENLKEAYACCECGICEMYACPMWITPCYMNIYMKTLLRKAGIKPEKETENNGVNKMIDSRKIPTDKLVSRLNLNKYYHVHVKTDNPLEINPSVLTVMLNQHIGMPAEAIVKAGDRVEKGQMIAVVPMDKVGANVHAARDGIVESVDGMKIVINVK